MTVKLIKILLIAGLLSMASGEIFGQVSSGGNFVLEQTSLASGGDTSNDTTNNVFSVSGTIGQAIIGANASGGAFASGSGFWNAVLAPTAAGVNISGKVCDTEGNGLRNIAVILAGGVLTAPRIVKTNNFGSFSFEDVAIGETYVVSVSNKKYGFQQHSFVISPNENVADIVFQAGWQN